MVSFNPNYALAYYNLGRCFALKGENIEAAKYFQLALDVNNITNEILRAYGIKVFEMKSAELSRGRGGPRCMSMPLIRED